MSNTWYCYPQFGYQKIKRAVRVNNKRRLDQKNKDKKRFLIDLKQAIRDSRQATVVLEI